jgi:hypothetical protein
MENGKVRRVFESSELLMAGHWSFFNKLTTGICNFLNLEKASKSQCEMAPPMFLQISLHNKRLQDKSGSVGLYL